PQGLRFPGRDPRVVHAGERDGALARDVGAHAAGPPRKCVRPGLHAGAGLQNTRPFVHGRRTLQLRVASLEGAAEKRAMGHRLSRIYTRTGDDGTTGLGDGQRVRKDSSRVEAYGTVDEANSTIGLVLA